MSPRRDPGGPGRAPKELRWSKIVTKVVPGRAKVDPKMTKLWYEIALGTVRMEMGTPRTKTKLNFPTSSTEMEHHNHFHTSH